MTAGDPTVFAQYTMTTGSTSDYNQVGGYTYIAVEPIYASTVQTTQVWFQPPFQITDPCDPRYLPAEELKNYDKEKCEYCGTSNLLPRKQDKIIALKCGACGAPL